MTFTAESPDGCRVELELLATTVHPVTGKEYILYTDFEAQCGRSKVYAAQLLEGSHTDVYRLGEINSEDEWSYLEDVLSTILEDLDQPVDD